WRWARTWPSSLSVTLPVNANCSFRWKSLSASSCLAVAAADCASASLLAVCAFAIATLARSSAAFCTCAVASANIENARAVVEQKQAALDQAQLDLDRTVLRAPIDGIIIKRDVNPGQTVGPRAS